MSELLFEGVEHEFTKWSYGRDSLYKPTRLLAHLS